MRKLSPPSSSLYTGIMGNAWWKETTVYQVYPRSFQDTTGNGVGDLTGIISRLDYLQELGIETLWISPFYPSPQQDLGYDISDYCNVSSEYGSLEIFDRLLKGVHERGMKLVLDMVLNHTSNHHPWFLESESSRTSPKRDWYVWKDGKKPEGKAPPNNWRSMIGGSGWHYHRHTGQWYWASFLPFQPDLNYRNPEVKQEMFKVLRFWLDRGIDGFRLDIIGSVYEDPLFRDNPFTWKLLPDENNSGFLFRSHKRTQNHPDNFSFARELRSLVDEYSSPERLLIGETFGPPDVLRSYCGRNKPDGLHLVFLFKSMAIPFKAGPFRKLIEEFETTFHEPFIPTYVFSNHDRFRRFSVLGEDIRKAKLNTVLQLTLRGVPFIYYGEEIGMRQGRIPPKDTRDAVARYIGTAPPVKIRLINRLNNGAVQRDGCRTPMQWDASANAGFTVPAEEAWMPINDNSVWVNAAEQRDRGDSLYSCYKELLKIRADYVALRRGTLELLPEKELKKELLGYIRSTSEGENVLVLLNFSSRKRPLGRSLSGFLPPGGTQHLLFSTDDDRTSENLFEGPLVLHPYEGLIVSTAPQARTTHHQGQARSASGQYESSIAQLPQ